MILEYYINILQWNIRTYCAHTHLIHCSLVHPARHCLTGRALACEAQSNIRKNWWALDSSTASNTASNKVFFTLPAGGDGSIFLLPFSATLQQFWKKSNSQYLHLRHSLQTHTAKMNYEVMKEILPFTLQAVSPQKYFWELCTIFKVFIKLDKRLHKHMHVFL